MTGGLISIPAVGADAKVTAGVRAAILHHELSHGEFFSNPAYADYVHRFWLTELTDAERDGVRRFLAKEAYDASLEEVMYNEMQAYLMFTRDPVFFTPAMAGLTPERLQQLQTKFLSGMPAGWLRDGTGELSNGAVRRAVGTLGGEQEFVDAARRCDGYSLRSHDHPTPSLRSA